MARSQGLKRSAAIVAAMSLAAMGLTACSGGDDKSGDSAGSGDGDKVTIQYTHRLPDGEGMVLVKDIVDRWNAEHPDIQVEATKFDGQAHEMIKKLENDISAKSAPCLAQLGYGEVPEMYMKGLVEDVTAEAEKYKDNFSGAYGQMVVGGVAVGLPQDTGPLVYFYDQAEFDALGLSVPTTMDELKATAKEAAAQGKYILDFEPDEAQYWLSGQAAAAGDAWYDGTGDVWTVNTQGEGAQRVAEFWQELIDEDAVLTINRWDDAYTKALTDKELIGNIGAAWEAGFMLDGVVNDDEEGTWQVALLPDFGAGALTGPDGGSGVAVLKGCEFPEQAMEFNNWFNTQTEDLATQGLVVAALGDVKTPDKVKRQFGGQEVFSKLAEANETLSEDFAYIPGFSAVGAKMNEVASNVIDEGGKIADIFKAAQEESVTTLKGLNIDVKE